tara:strand:+ start:34 stop:1392 length:1359 start_codon:yes stop_codon:yes gene_type:complete
MKWSSLFVIWLSLNLAYADVTGNLITNGNFDDGTTGWTLSGDAQRINDCCPGGHDLEFGDSGSIEQTFDLINTHITQPMLNNGITLNSTVEIQNGECGVQGCWGGSGPADKTIVRLQILDESSNVLAVTTQERYDVTGINGEDFTDSVSYTGIGSNMGNIYIFGSDSNSPATLGGPNVDNISVTMTYDPVVLSTEQVSQISTAVEEVEVIEEFKFEEIKFEEIKFEEVKIEEYKEPEFSLVKFFEEEIVTGVINIFEEVKYEEPKTIETFTAEVESFEEVIEESESTNIEEQTNEQNQTVGGNSEAERIEESGSEETIATNTDTGSTTDNVPEVQAMDQESVEDIRESIVNTVNTVDQQLVTTQTLVAKVMSNNAILNEYNSTNQSIFNNQLDIDGGNVDDYYRRNYNDDRNIYAQVTYGNQDPVQQYQTKVNQAVEQRIKAEQHLRRIRGY